MLSNTRLSFGIVQVDNGFIILDHGRMDRLPGVEGSNYFGPPMRFVCETPERLSELILKLATEAVINAREGQNEGVNK